MLAMKSRNGMIDLWKFIFCFLIAAHHLYFIYIPEPYPFLSAWIYVEFFFIVTGYFTAVHFFVYDDSDNVVKSVSRYTYRKFRSIYPYIFIAITAQYLIECIASKPFDNLSSFVIIICNYIAETLLISATGFISAHVGPIWFVSGMFISIPVVAFFLKNNYLKKVYLKYLSWLFPLLYYTKVGISGAGVYGNLDWPHRMVRPLAAMSIGVFVYWVTRVLNRREFSRFKFILVKIIVTFLEISCLLMTIYFTYNNEDCSKEIVLLFIIGLICCFSGFSYTSVVHGKIFDMLGKFSMVFYLIQSPVALCTNLYIHEVDTKNRIIMYYVVLIVSSIVLMLIVENVKKVLKRCYQIQ